MKTYREGSTFNGRIGRWWAESEPAFPMKPKAPKGAPNVVYVVLDDVGFGWCDTFGGLVETPNITRLADNGLRYTNFHTTALCSPTRSCLLNGRNHHSNGMANITELATGYPGYYARQPLDRAGAWGETFSIRRAGSARSPARAQPAKRQFGQGPAEILGAIEQWH